MVQLHPLTHAQFAGKAHRSGTKLERQIEIRSPRDRGAFLGFNLIGWVRVNLGVVRATVHKRVYSCIVY